MNYFVLFRNGRRGGGMDEFDIERQNVSFLSKIRFWPD